MNRALLSVLTISALAAACAEAPAADVQPHYESVSYDDPSDELYALHNLPRFDLQLSEAALDDLQDEPREYTRGTLRYRGQVIPDIGVRLKGEFSFRPIDDKPAFKLKFDKFVDNQRFFGLKRMTLNNNVQDPSFLSQPLAYKLFRSAGLPAPRCNSALVFVNGEYYGVYSNVETEDKVFLARWFADDSGNLYEEGGVDFVPGAAAQFDLETNEEEDDRRDLEQLIAVIDAASNDTFMAEVGQHLDIQHYLNYVAMEALIGGEDGYSYGLGSRNNFRIYRDPTTQRFVFLPWGLDRALRPRFDPQHVHEWIAPLPVYQSPWDARGLLLQRCIDSAGCRQAFRDRLTELTGLFEQMDLRGDANRLFSLIADAVYADERKTLDNEYVDYARTTLVDYANGRPAAVRAEL